MDTMVAYLMSLSQKILTAGKRALYFFFLLGIVVFLKTNDSLIKLNFFLSLNANTDNKYTNNALASLYNLTYVC